MIRPRCSSTEAIAAQRPHRSASEQAMAGAVGALDRLPCSVRSTSSTPSATRNAIRRGVPAPGSGTGTVMVRSPRTIAAAAVVAGALSGVPSTVHALVTGRPLGAATRAAGTLLGDATVPRGVLAHAGVTLWWTIVLAAVLPRGGPWRGVRSAAAPSVCSTSSIARRRFPAIAALPAGPAARRSRRVRSARRRVLARRRSLTRDAAAQRPRQR